MVYARIIEEHMELCFFTVRTRLGAPLRSNCYNDWPQELLCSCFDDFQVRQIEVQEEGFVACFLFELADRLFRLGSVSCGDVDPCAVGKENLVKSRWFFKLTEQERVRQMVHTLTVSLPMPVFAPVTMMTLPVRSGMSCVLKVCVKGKASQSHVLSACMMTVEGAPSPTRTSCGRN